MPSETSRVALRKPRTATILTCVKRSDSPREGGPGKEIRNVKVLVTGSSGLIGSEAVEHFDRQGHDVTGVDNNMRREFFGPAGDTLWNLERLRRATKRFTHAALDIRDRAAMEELFRTQRFDLIVHCAAQPSHDKVEATFRCWISR